MSEPPDAQATARHTAPNVASLGADARVAGATESWWQSVSTQIASSEYEPKATEEGLQAPNRAQNLRTTFSMDGIEVVPRTTEDVAPAWKFGWKTSGIGREGSMREVDVVSPESGGNRVTYSHEGWSEWYVNKSAGLEQGFTIEQRPDGNGPLRIMGTVAGALTPVTREDGAIDFLDAHGACGIRYGELHTWDANGVELQSELMVQGSDLAIVIDDSDAEYPLIVDPLMTSPAWTVESNQDTANFGVSVATAGDVNGDGFSDVIVGAQLFDSPTVAEGKAFLYYGSASGLSLTANWTTEGNQLGSQLGYSVATAGDVNGDGFDDVIVGAFSFNNGESDEGRAFVFHGSASGPSSTADWTGESNQASANYGIAVATAGDVNDDGFDDVIVGAYFFDNGQIDEGRAYVYHGSASGLSLSANWTAESNGNLARFGTSVSTAGDVNGDGFDDVIVGANLYVGNDDDEGRAYLYHGSASGLNPLPAWFREGNQAGARYGNSVSTAGDVNGDGYSDILVGAYGIDSPEANEGRVYAYYGSSSGLSLSANWTAESNVAGAFFGYAASTAGDVNGDGYADVIIGAYVQADGETEEGEAFVYHGSASGLSANPDWGMDCDQSFASFGFSVATAGDVNGDGFSDVIVGAYLFDNGQTDEGRAFVYHGAASGLATAFAWTAESNQNGSSFGVSAASAGDVNGDGYSDVIVGASHYDNGQTDEGRVFVYHGSAVGLSPAPSWTAESDHAAGFLGISVASAGDVNGDGYSDVIIGSIWFETGVDGKAFVYHGSATGLAASPAWFVEGPEESNFSRSVATAGDVNGDGFSDVIVTSTPSFQAEENEGRVYVYHGSAAGLEASPAWFAEGVPDVWTAFGSSVSTAGDVNGDGFSDVIVGNSWYANGEQNEGRALVYHGSAIGLSLTANWTAESNQVSAFFGQSVSTTGDVNGDGYSDVIVGADWYNAGVVNEGQAFVYHGSAAGLSASAAWTADGGQGLAHLGFSVASAGDVNGDGYSDVIVGAPEYDNPEIDEGQARVYHGSASGLSVAPQWFAEINQASAYFGQVVATAGDVNGDGFSDVIVGSWQYANGQADEGGAWVYYGNAGGGGLDRIARQARSDDAGPIDLLGSSDSESAFRLKTRGRTAAGRAGVRLQAEVKPLGVPFDGSGLFTGFEANTGAPSAAGSVVSLSEVVSGLSGNTLYHWRLRTVSDSPLFPWSPWSSQVGNAPSEADFRTAAGAVAVVEPSGAATYLWLAPNAPNPFTEETHVAYTLPERGRVRLAVYDVAGRQVAVLADGMQDGGRHSQAWNGRASRGTRMSAGVYFVRLEFDGRAESRKMVLTR